MGVGATVWNTLKGGGTEKSGGETNILKRDDKLGMGALKKGGGGLEPPHELWFLRIFVV